MQVRAYKLAVRSTGAGGPGTFTGYASVFGNIDSYGTVVDPGAFKKSIKDHDGIFPLIDFHWPDRAAGLIRVQEDKKGLLSEGALDLDIQRGHDLYSGLKFGEKVAELGWGATAGYIDRMSIGFDVITEEKKEGVSHFREIGLWEVSLVTRNFAANEQALVTDVRAACAGLQRVNAAIRAGAEDELRSGLDELRELLGAQASQVDPLSEFMAETRERLTELTALLRSEGPSLDTLPAEPRDDTDEPQQHSPLEELRAFRASLETTLQNTR